MSDVARVDAGCQMATFLESARGGRGGWSCQGCDELKHHVSATTPTDDETN